MTTAAFVKMDDEESTLYEAKIKSEHAYLTHVLKKYQKRFVEEVGDRTFDQESNEYKAMTQPSDRSIEPSTRSKELYRKLSLKTHPDKNGSIENRSNENSSGELFSAIHDAYGKDNVSELERMDKLLEMNVAQDKIVELSAIAKSIDEMQKSFAYLWCTNPCMKELIEKSLKT